MLIALAVAALVAGIAGAWSPCGFSMVDTLAPRRYARSTALAALSCVTFAGGALAGGVATFGGLALLGATLGASHGALLSDLGELRLTALLALSAIGIGHVPPNALAQGLALLGTGGLFAFAVTPNLLPGSEDAEGQASGYPQFLTDLLERTEELGRAEYVHRRYADGTDHLAVALVGRVTDAPS